jgi:hypothetical protein
MWTFAQKQKPTQQTKSVNYTTHGRAFFGQNHAVRSILQLQRTIGNQAVQRLLQSNTESLEASSSSKTSTGFAHHFSRIPIHARGHSNIQLKLKVAPSGDKYEQEADRVAFHVMRMAEFPLQRTSTCGASYPKCSREQNGHERLKRQTAERHEKLIQTERTPEIDSAGASVRARQLVPALESHQGSVCGGGQSLSSNTRGFMENRFGRDFSDVRIHTGGPAAGSMLQRQAEAEEQKEPKPKKRPKTWGRKHTRGPRLFDGRSPSYQVFFDHVVPKVPKAANQLWQVVEARKTLLSSDCKPKTEKTHIVDIVDLGKRERIGDSWGWIPDQSKSFCVAVESNKAKVGFGPEKKRLAQQTNVEVTASLAKRTRQGMLKPIAAYTGRYTFIKPNNCPKCKKFEKLKKQFKAIGDEHLKIESVGEWKTEE